MLDQTFRQHFAKHNHSLVGLLKRLNIQPNSLSIFGFLLALIAAYLIATDHSYLGLAVWYVNRLCDGLDGSLARSIGKQSPFGGYLDILLDMASYSIMILAFQHKHPAFGLVWSGILVGYVLCITSVLALSSILEGSKNSPNQEIQKLTASNNRSVQFTSALAEASETTLAYTMFVFFEEHIFYLSLIWLLIVITTVLQRTLLAKKLLNNLNSTSKISEL
jgi:phosphatidylglycerophosphate synthase